MKYVLVTSSVTFTPHNYTKEVEETIRVNENSIVGIVILKISLRNRAKAFALLLLSGSWNLLFQFFCNNMDDLFGLKKRLFKKHNAPVYSTHSLSDTRTLEWLRQRNTDLLINMRSREFFPKVVLEIPTHGCINVHHGLLTEQKGLMCDLRAIAQNRETGFSIHAMTSVIDSGAVFVRHPVLYTTKKYLTYLQNLASEESAVVPYFFKQIIESGQFPKALTLSDKDEHITSNPTLRELRSLKKSGMIL